MSDGFQAGAQPLFVGEDRWAEVRLLPWDTEIFGFGSAGLELRLTRPEPTWRAAAATALRAWADAHGAVVIATSVSAAERERLDAMPELGFTVVDLALTMGLTITKRRPRTLRGAQLRLAEPADHAGIERIAARDFEFGRYHRDARFPRALANRRFAVWIGRGLATPRPGTRFFVMGPLGEPTGFMWAEIENGRAMLHLAAVDRSSSNGLAGPRLFAGTVDALEQEGVRNVSGKISAANTPVLNIYAALGFHASAPEYTFHWRQKDSPHLAISAES